MKLLLLNPFQITSSGYNTASVRAGGQYAEAPLGLGYISSFCKKVNKIETKIIDANIFAIKNIVEENYYDIECFYEGILDEIKKYNPDVVGISCLFHVTSKIVHRFADEIKIMNKYIIVVLGGSYPTASPQIALRDDNVDYVVFGEGEKATSDILFFLNGKKKIEDIEGIAYKINNKVIFNKKIKYVNDINGLPFPDRSDFPMLEYSEYGRHVLKKFFVKNKSIIATMTATRGCPNHCSFCISKIFWNRTYRFRTAESVLDELDLLVKKYGVTHICFNDDNLTLNKTFAKEVMNGMIDRKLNIKWIIAGGISVQTLTKELIELMIRSGCVLFNLAIETASSRLLKKIRKPLTLKMVEDRIVDLRTFDDAYIVGFFMVGFPDETEEEFFKTISYGKNLDLDWVLFSCVQPYPGTELYNDAFQNNLISKDIEKDFEKLSWRYSVLKTQYLTKELIEKESYLANLERNFVNNRNLNNGNVDQAIRDFRWVVELVPDHAVGYHSLARAYKKKGDNKLSEYYRDLVKKNMTKKNMDYFENLKIN